MKTKIQEYMKWGIRKKTKPTVQHVLTATMRCGHCGELFAPEDEFHNCPKCNHDHCKQCGGNWSASDYNECPICFPEERHDERPDGMELRTVPGTSLTYFA